MAEENVQAWRILQSSPSERNQERHRVEPDLPEITPRELTKKTKKPRKPMICRGY